MTKYAYYDQNILANNQIIGWIDSDIEKNMPNSNNLLLLTQDEWDNRTSDIFYVSNNALVGSRNILHLAKTIKQNDLTGKCKKMIIGGFISEALGVQNFYTSSDIDQRNLLSSAQSSNGGLISCKDSSNIWIKTQHSREQAQKVLDDFVTFRDNMRLKLQNYIQQINNSSSIEELNSITWD